MTELFLTILNMSQTASILILAVILLRLPLRRAPGWIKVLLWGIAALRLVCPFSPESTLSLIPRTEWVSGEAEEAPLPTVPDVIIPSPTGEAVSVTYEHNDAVIEVRRSPTAAEIGSMIWLTGCFGMAAYGAVSYIRLKKQVREAVRYDGNVYLSPHIPTPFVLGIVSPKVYLPHADSRLICHVIAHEEAHIRRGDHLIKPLGFLILALHWFNPLCHIGYALLCRDIESACDEKVIASLTRSERADYSEALLNCSAHRRRVSACPLAFGENNVKARIKNVLGYKKPAPLLITAAVAVCGIVALCFLTNPTDSGVSADLRNFAEEQILRNGYSSHSDGHGCFADVEILGRKKEGVNTVLYTMALYEEYSFDGELKQESGSHIPTVITVTKADGIYRLVSLETPRDGSYYAEDIRALFPFRLWLRASDTTRYIDRQKVRIREKAEAYFGAVPLAGGADTPTDHTGIIEAPETVAIGTFYGTAAADIDGDGREEALSLGMGRTSGIFTFTLTAREGDVTEYERTFTSEWYDLSFIEADGTVKVQGITADTPPETHVFDIAVTDGVIDLVQNGVSVTGEVIKTEDISFTAVIRDWAPVTREGFVGCLDIDLVDYVTADDADAVEKFGLSEADLTDGYAILNPTEKLTFLNVPEGTLFVFCDWGDDFRDDPRCISWENRWVTTADMSLFMDYLNTYNKPLSGKKEDMYPRMPFTFTTQNGSLTITEIFLM
ncbi:MAG: hypothetical protein E7638_06150 [Ruminococcaceae bacterium]|nr:hypothetical protein [Oscillospiraceae bacterium]